MTDLLYVVRLKEDVENLLEPRSDEEVDDEGVLVIEESDDEKKRKKRAKRRKSKQVIPDVDLLSVDVEESLAACKGCRLQRGVLVA